MSALQPIDKTEIAEYREGMQRILREAGPKVAALWVQKAVLGGKVEDLRKLTEFIVDATAAKVERKVDPHSDLPVFNITFDIHTGAMSGSVVTAPVVDDVVEMEPTAPAVAPGSVEQDTAELFAMLDEALAELS